MKNLENKSQIVIKDNKIAAAEILFGAGLALTSQLIEDNFSNWTVFIAGMGFYLAGGMTYINGIFEAYSRKKD